MVFESLRRMFGNAKGQVVVVCAAYFFISFSSNTHIFELLVAHVESEKGGK